jgi:hypothetical protein
MIGGAIAEMGTGPVHTWTVGPVYLTDGYGGAQYGLSIPFEALAGPFELDEVVARAAVAQSPSTGALSIATDPLPRIVDGIPLRTRSLAVVIDRRGFVVSPTSCESQQIAAAVEGSQGTTVDLSTPFAAHGCQPAPAAPVPVPAAQTAPPARVVIVSSKIVVTGGVARIGLRCEGAPCTGRLALLVKAKAKRGRGRHRLHNVTIGVTRYSIAAGETAMVTVRLNRLGLHRLRARHGRLPATALLSPTSGTHETRVVHLIRRGA